MVKNDYKRLKGCQSFRQRLVLATLWYFDYYRGYSRRLDFPGSSETRGLFLRLLEKICDGCYVEINEAATKLKYKPGIVMGGKNLAHDCGVSRSNWLFLGTAARSCFIWEEGPRD